MGAWFEKEVAEASVEALAKAGMPRIAARLLALRGITPESLHGFFNPDWRNLAPPGELDQVDEAAGVILSSLRNGDKTVIFGDYDCDGVCATAIMAMALRGIVKSLFKCSEEDAARRVATFLPERLTEGYGLTEASVSRLFFDHPDVKLLVTVDNGVNAVDQIAAITAHGVKVVVTDHHLPGEVLPAAAALVNPKVSSTPRLSDLCGAAVAYFLANRLVEKAREESGDPEVAKGLGGMLFTLAGLATVTDIMPLGEQNRILVAEALKHFQHWAPVGLRELHLRAARSGAERLTTRDFGFVLGPRINAAGRLSSSSNALRLLLCPGKDREISRALAMEIDVCNSSRRSIEQRMTEAAIRHLAKGANSQVIDFPSSDPDVHPGVSGIVASRLMERLDPQVPVCVLVDGKGSSRAPAGYNVRAALAASSAQLSQFGGHAAAAGLTVKEGAVEEFRKTFDAACLAQAKSIPAAACASRSVDMYLKPAEITLELAEQIARMEPFGEGNPEPVFAISGVTLASGGIRIMGTRGQHIQLLFAENAMPRAIWWGHGDMAERLRAVPGRKFDISFTITISDYGARHPEISIVDMLPADGHSLKKDQAT